MIQEKIYTWSLSPVPGTLLLKLLWSPECWLLLLNCSVRSDSLWPHGLQHTRLPCPSLTPRSFSNLCPLNQWYLPTISSSVVPFSSCLQSFPASEYFLMSQFFTSGSIGASVSASVLPKNIQDLFPLGLTALISLHWKGLSRVLSTTTVQSIHSLVLSFLYGPTLISIHDYWKNHSFDIIDLCQWSNVSAF